MMIWRRFLLALAALLSCVVASAAELGTQLSFDPLDATANTGWVSPDLSLLPLDTAKAREPFLGTLIFTETRLNIDPEHFKSSAPEGKDARLFPAVRLSFTTVGDDLLPATADLVGTASTAGAGESSWNMRVLPGKVWSDPAEEGWSRGAFPFELVATSGGETLQGRATLRYRGHELGGVYYEILPPPDEKGERKGLAAAGVLSPSLVTEAPVAHMD